MTRGQKLSFIKPDAKAIKSPYNFAPRGDSGMVMSELFPHLATVADELTMIRSMRTNEINHGSGRAVFSHRTWTSRQAHLRCLDLRTD